jgi:LmbE family N-acetylglucosaminyl deacetylase
MKILFAFAHPDDEAYGPAGTIRRLTDAGHDVWVLSFCRGNRLGAESVEDTRQRAFKKSCKILGAKPIMLDSTDTQLKLDVAVRELCRIIDEIKPDAIYTHNISDVHQDHRIAAEAALIAARPKPESTIQAFYMCEIPAATDWSFGQLGDHFVPTTFVRVTDLMDVKRQVLELYSTEIYEYPDARSVKSMEVLAMNRGRVSGVEYAEAFKLIFEVDRTCRQ